MSIDTWLGFCLAEIVLCITPGPAVLLIVGLAARRGLPPTIGAAFGIVAANTLYFALSATGIAAVLIASRELFVLIKWAGAAYLIWIGLRMLLARTDGAAEGRPVPHARTFAKGFVVQGANPKALIFFVAFLPQFLDPAAPIATQLTILGGSSVVIELASLGTYAYFAARAGRAAAAPIARWLERASGGLLVAAGARLATLQDD